MITGDLSVLMLLVAKTGGTLEHLRACGKGFRAEGAFHIWDRRQHLSERPSGALAWALYLLHLSGTGGRMES